jgi:aminomethyltransferase
VPVENNKDGLKGTVLQSRHLAAGARLVPFAGYSMPLSYGSIINEHRAVRDGVGLFDLSHMGQVFIDGDGALTFLDRMLSNDPRRLAVGRAQYTLLLNREGGLIDDLILYRLQKGFLLVVNAARQRRDVDWLMNNLPPEGVDLEDRSEDYGIIAVQGPSTCDLLEKIGTTELNGLYYMDHREVSLLGCPVILSCSGYTGEAGCEIMTRNENLPPIWDNLVSDRGLNIRPVGLGARDTLRTEMCYYLYGQELDEETNPIEADLGWVCRGADRDFLGKAKVDEVEKKGPDRSLVAFRTSGPVPPRPGYDISIDGKIRGRVTSGTWSPSLETGIGMGFVSPDYSETGTGIILSGRGRQINGVIESKPLYHDGSIRRKPKK